MNGDIFDDIEAEAFDYLGDSEDLYGEDLEAVRNDARARAARAKLLARAKLQARARGRGSPQTPPPRPAYTPPPVPSRPANTTQVARGFTNVSKDMQQTKAAVQHVDLKNMVQSDLIAQALRNQKRRIAGSEYAFVASKVVDELNARFPDLFPNDVIQSLLRAAPLLAISGDPMKGGLQSTLLKPNVVGPAAIGLLAVISLFRDRTQEVQTVIVTPGNARLRAGNTISFQAEARDRNNNTIKDRSFTWKSNTTAVTIDVSGNATVATSAAAGTTQVTATESKTGLIGTALIEVVTDGG